MLIEYIKGILTESSPNKVTLEINGIGYALWIPMSTFAKLPPIGQPILLYVFSVIREDCHQYFGFITKQERDLCETLTSISGIGPKTATNIIGNIEINTLRSAIAAKDILSLSKIPGVGKKTAERLIIELKDKLKVTEIVSANSQFTDAVAALVRLGYTSFQAQKAVKITLDNSKKELDLPSLITSALRSIK